MRSINVQYLLTYLLIEWLVFMFMTYNILTVYVSMLIVGLESVALLALLLT